MPRASLWTALRVVYDIAVCFCSGKCSELRSSSYNCSSNSMLWSSLLLYAMLSGVFGIVNSPSSVTVGITKPCRSGDFDPTGSHQLPIAGSDGDQFLLTLRT